MQKSWIAILTEVKFFPAIFTYTTSEGSSTLISFNYKNKDNLFWDITIFLTFSSTIYYTKDSKVLDKLIEIIHTLTAQELARNKMFYQIRRQTCHKSHELFMYRTFVCNYQENSIQNPASINDRWWSFSFWDWMTKVSLVFFFITGVWTKCSSKLLFLIFFICNKPRSS